MMNPQERECYVNGEANLTYLPDSRGYKFSLDNCIVNQLIMDIIWNFSTPTFCKSFRNVMRFCNIFILL